MSATNAFTTTTAKKRKKNAFDILMASARVPGAFEQAPTFFLGQDDNDDNDSFKRNQHGIPEPMLYEFEKSYDPVVCDALTKIHDAIHKHAEKSLQYYPASAAARGGEALPLPSTVDHPPASKDACLKTLTVYFREVEKVRDDDDDYQDTVAAALYCDSDCLDGTLEMEEEVDDYYDLDSRDKAAAESKHKKDDLRISGFLLKYSDGTETEIGVLYGSSKMVTVDLQPDEHVNSVCQDADERGIVRLWLETTEEREYCFCGGSVKTPYDDDEDWDSSSESDCDCWDTRDAERLEMLPRGSVLRSMVWCDEGRTIRQVLTQERPPKANGSRPFGKDISGPKAELAKLKEEARLLGEDKIFRACTQAQDFLLDFYLKGRAEALCREYRRQEEEHRKHRDKDFFNRRMRYFHTVESILKIHDKGEHLALDQKRDLVIASAKRSLEQELRKLRMQTQWDALYKKHASQHARRVSHGLAPPGTRLCPCCFGSFAPAHVRSLQRCSVAGCFDRYPNCGCYVSPCDRCHTPLCVQHETRHEESCKTSFAFKCGWKQGRNSLNPDFCGQVPSAGGELRACIRCKTLCCEQCRLTCVGRPSTGKEKRLEDRSENGAQRYRSKDCRAVWCRRCEKESCSFRRQCCEDCADAAESSSDEDASDEEYMAESNESFVI